MEFQQQRTEPFLFTRGEIKFFKGVGISLLLLVMMSVFIFIPPIILGWTLLLIVAPVIAGFYGGRQYPKKGFKIGATAGFIWSMIFIIVLLWLFSTILPFMEVRFGDLEFLFIIAIFTLNTLLCGFGGRFAKKKKKILRT